MALCPLSARTVVRSLVRQSAGPSTSTNNHQHPIRSGGRMGETVAQVNM